MDKDLVVLLVEDDEYDRSEIRNYIDITEGVVLAASTASSTQGIEYVSSYLPDVVILDLELHKGEGNGLNFLIELKKNAPVKRPYILITTNNSSQITYDKVRELGADFIMYKMQTDYSAKYVVDFILNIKDALVSTNRYRNNSVEKAVLESPNQLNKRIANRINAELEALGISPKLVGRKYLRDAILTVIEKPQSYICGAIAEKYGKSDSSVERAMNHAITATWRAADIDVLCSLYTAHVNSDKGCPTITEFIYYYADKISQDFF